MREDYRNKRAVVIGASMGGLLAARALADYYGEVTVVERDALPDGYEPRKGVPQGRHTHGLLARGREVREQLFPGFTEEMIAQGASSGDIVDKVLWFNHGFYLCNSPSKLFGLAISRPMLEGNVRCVKKSRKRHAVVEMKVGPSESPCRRRLQTTLCCFGQKPRW